MLLIRIEMALVGYARVSTIFQEAGFEAQIAELRRLGCEKLFSEQVSAVDASRPQLKAALDYLREGDVFIVTRLCRLARSVAHLCQIVAALDAKGVALKVLDMNLDTSTANGKLMLNMMAAISQFERELQRERQRVGVAKAKLDGRYKGRKPTARAKTEQVFQMDAEGLKRTDIAKRLDIGVASVYRILASARPQVVAA